MASFKVIKRQIANVRSIQKITQSMKMVSAAKFARLERILKKVKPFGTGSSDFYKYNFKEPNIPVASDVFMVTTSDRGLCGSMHTQVCRLAIKELETNKQERDKCKIICIGDKARAVLRFHYSKNIMLVVSDIGRSPPQYLDASRIFNEVKKFKFLYGKIFYNEFKSRISSKTNILSIYDMAAVNMFANLNSFDDIESEDLQSFMEFSTTSLLFYALLQNSCSEQSSRMSAMDSASKNCNQMLSKLNITYNRLRQAYITQELVEIISGAAVITGS